VTTKPALKVHALRTKQGGTEVFAFFLPGSRLLEIAEIARISRSKATDIEGFQRPEIKAHVRRIAEYLGGGEVLFPNAIILAFAPGVRFAGKRGTKNKGADPASTGGVLTVPARPGRKAAWIVDGQQRALALAEASGSDVTVPVVGFVSGDLSVHREQFILVNKARPLDRRLIDELLPSVGAMLPRDLSARRIPSALCAVLADTRDSPFYQLVKRPSFSPSAAVVTDSSLTGLMRRSLQDPRGALAAHVGPDGSADLEAMYAVMKSFWSAVRDVFPDAWGLPPDRSRLMHAAGLAALGVLMDQVMTRPVAHGGEYAAARIALERIAPDCRWTGGRWEMLDREWNDVQCVTKDVRALSNLLVSLERDATRKAAA
jgi:DGQHR domain-containing protein